MILPSWAIIVLQIAFFAIVILVVYKQIKERFLYKFNPNKWILLGVAGIVFLIPIILKEYYYLDVSKSLWQYVDSTIFIILFLWFVDVANGSMKKFGENKNKPQSAVNNQIIKQQTISAKKNRKNKNRDIRRKK
ncbi:MAG: hypothetical protein ACM3X7_12490 [Solirubrobacterales bacterium]